MASVDNIYLVVAFLSMMLIVLSMGVVWNEIKDVDVLWSNPDVGSAIKQDTQDFVDKWDFIMACLWIGTHLSVLVLGYLLRSHPVVLVLGIVMMILLVVIAAPISNAYETISQDAAYSGVINNFPMMNHIMLRLPFYELIWGVLTLIIIYGFARYGEA